MNRLNLKSGLLAGALSIAIAVPAMAVTFSDTQSNWARQDIEQLTDKGVISGYTDGTFKPEQSISRGDFVEAFKRAYSLGPADTASLPTLQKLSSDSSRPVTRAEALAAVAEALSTPKAGTISVQREITVRNYSDASQVPTWATGGINRTLEYNVYVNTPEQPDNLSPQAPLSRAEAAVLLNNMIEHNQMVASAGSVKSNPDSVQVIVATPLYTRFNKVGDKVVFVTNETAVTPDGKLLVPGSKLYGTVSDVEKATKNISGKLGVQFTYAITPDNERFPVNARLAVADSKGVGDVDEIKNILTISNTRSFEQLKAEVRSEMGSMVGTSAGKMQAYNDSLAIVVPYNDEIRTSNSKKDVLLGVGDHLELRFAAPDNTNNNR